MATRGGPRRPSAGRSRRLAVWASLALLAAAAWGVARAADPSALRSAWSAAISDPAGVPAVLAAYALAFAVRALAWRRVLPGLGFGQALAALHLALAANHVLPFRLGEAARVASVVRRGGVPVGVAAASTLTLRAADILALGALGVALGPRVVLRMAGPAGAAVLAAAMAAAAAGVIWLHRARRGGARVRVPGPLVAAAAGAAWVLEGAVLWKAARWAGIHLGPGDAVLATAVTIAAQTLGVTPGGFGTYEAAATGALVALGADPGPALAAALGAHALKTAYSLGAGALAFFVPAPGMHGRLRLPAGIRPRPRAAIPGDGAPVVLLLPARNEEGCVGGVVSRVPATVCGRRVVCLVVDDGSSDRTAAVAAASGAAVVSMPGPRGLGAALRRGLAEAVAMDAAAVAFCDADGEYAPEELERLVLPILAGRADYVAGSRFASGPGSMRRMRALGNLLLTRALAWVARTPVGDAQSGYRAMSAEAAAEAEIVHDYNYAQVLTLDLLAKGFRYLEVPISYRHRSVGRSFVRLVPYLRAVVPAVYRELNRAPDGDRERESLPA